MDRERKDSGGEKAAAPERERFVIDTGLFFVNGRTGQRWKVFTCSDNQESSSWIDTAGGGVPTPDRARRVFCNQHKEKHELISLSAAAYSEVLNIQDGNVCVPFGQVVSMLLDPDGETAKPAIAFSAERRTA